METEGTVHWWDGTCTGSYRTYEEWKHTDTRAFLKLIAAGSYRTYEEWKPLQGYLSFAHRLVLTVPMRNGNEFQVLIRVIALSVLTVPMRNGNDSTSAAMSLRNALGSYRTYEEWKPSPVLLIASFVFCSYRTYEEWKQTVKLNLLDAKPSFLPYL